MLKKVQCEQIIMTPAPNVRIKLNDLNKILDEMKQGEEATRKLAEMDKQLGIQDPAQVARMMRGAKDARVEPITPVAASTGDALGDAQLANSFRAQAERMQREANGLMTEATRLLNEAAALTPSAAPAESSAPAPRRPGRPKKSATA
jgi:DNA-directed RNA polymerase sigma subunit (sigma70/sigma32)